MSENPNAFKLWINPKTVARYTRGLQGAPGFDPKRFKSLCKELDQHELKGRVRLLAHAFHETLGPDYKVALTSVLRAVKRERIEGFELWPVTEFIQSHGLAHFELSFAAIKDLTERFTGEFAIRAFIKKDPKRTLSALSKLTSDPNEHIRRWVSEGTRPRLPWGERLKLLIEDPGLSLKLLEPLKYDPALYVRKSVANHLNDIAKDHPELVIETLTRWERSVPKGYAREFAFIKMRALRTLIKAGDKGALKLMGVEASQALKLKDVRLSTDRVSLGEAIEFEFLIVNSGPTACQIIVDYAIHHQKADGTLSPKVFKLKTTSLEAGAELSVKKRHTFKLITTRKYYAGEHGLEILLNGIKGERLTFSLDL